MDFKLGAERLTCEKIYTLATQKRSALTFDKNAQKEVERYRKIVDKAVASEGTYYGINTGFGFMSDVKISTDKLFQLQENLIRSHAAGVGEPVSDEIVRALLVLRAHTFCLGHTGISKETVHKILEFFHKGIYPLIPAKGSVGASGDLAPLAHLALGLMGEGNVRYHGEVFAAEELLSQLSVPPLKPKAKEGLSLINGTHFMTAIGAFAAYEAKMLAKSADIIAAMTLDALRGTLKPFDERIHKLRHQTGQSVVSENMRALFSEDDEILESHKECGKVQDPYSLRCIPQVHGASRDALTYVDSVLEGELNSITDNPLCFENGDIISGGNFHGQPVALAMDFLCIAVAELGSISERRIEKITNPALSGLPAFAVEDGGLNSGFMIPHVVAASLVSENKVLCHPASVDSIPTSADKEDHVSMGPIAARKAREINQNLANILAIELLSACQGMDLLAPLKPGKALKEVYDKVRSMSCSLDRDRSLSHDMEKVGSFILEGGLLKLAGIDSLSLR